MLAVYLSPVYIIINGCLLFQIHRWLGACSGLFRKTWARAGISLGYAFLARSVPLAFFLPAGRAGRVMKIIGNNWLGILFYLLLSVLMADFLWFFSFRLRKRKAGRRFHVVAGGICAAVVVTLSLWGIYNAHVIHVTPYDITVEKDGGNRDSINVILVADLHLGYQIGMAHMSAMVEKINEQNADVVVVAGDIFDNEYDAIERPEELAEALRGIRSKYGVYACYGNHDIEEKILAGFTFGGSEEKKSSAKMDEFLKKAGIRLLRDEKVLIDDSFYLYGRPDAQRPGRGISKRKTAEEMVEGMDVKKPVIVIDHEPKEFDRLSAAGVDVDLCGHTHDGQIFPVNLITALLWENSYGYKKKGNLHTIVTSGVGLFGPNMRIGTVAEICPIRIHFQ